MKWHCVVNITGYCNGTPEWSKEPYEKQIARQEPTQDSAIDFIGGECKLTPVTCGKYQTLAEQLNPGMLEKISHPSYVETIVPIEKSKEKEGKKPKSKAAKKLEQEMTQRSMF